MPSKIALHWTPVHRDERDWELVSEARFKSIKVFDEQVDDPGFMHEIARRSPSSLITPRSWHRMGQDQSWWELYDNPEKRGREDAEFWHQKFVSYGMPVEKFAFNLLNEPKIWVPDGVQRLVRYTKAALERANELGIRLIVLNLSVGWPNNTGPDTPVDWAPFAPLLPLIKAGKHYLGLHEYWDLQGPEQNFGWWVGRLGQCPWDVPIIVGECGIDRGVVSQEFAGKYSRGWREHRNNDQYLEELKRYDAMMRADRRVHSCQLFTWDYGNDEWKGFDVRDGFREPLVAYVASQHNAPDPAPRAFPYYPANVSLPNPPTEPKPVSDKLATMFKAALGDKFVDARNTGADGPGEYARMDSSKSRYFVFHHSTGNRGPVSAASIDAYHSKTRQWPDIGYHGVIDEGKLYYTGDVDTQRAHILNRNTEGLGWCFTGDYSTQVPYAEDLYVARVLVKVLDEYYGHKKEITNHRALMAPGYTTCPGDALVRILPTLRTEAVPVPTGLTAEEKSKVIYELEEGARRQRAEGRQKVHDYMINVVIPATKKGWL